MTHTEFPSLVQNSMYSLDASTIKAKLSLALALPENVHVRQFQSWEDCDSDNSVMRDASAFDPLQIMMTTAVY